MFTRFSFIVCLVYSANALSAPFITKCKAEDSKCMKQSAQTCVPIFAAGIPELGVERLDPLNIKHLDASAAGLSLQMRDLAVTGLKDCIVKKVQRDTKNSKILVKVQCNVDVKSKYEMSGSLLVLAIEGKGDAHIILRKLAITVEANMGDTIGKDGQKFWNVKNFKHSYSLQDKSFIELSNLFNGNELLARAAKDLISSSSNDIVTEIGPPIVKTIVGKIVHNIMHFFENVPVNELALD